MTFGIAIPELVTGAASDAGGLIGNGGDGGVLFGFRGKGGVG